MQLFRWFESFINPFPGDAPAQPPNTLAAFYWHFIGPVWPVFAFLLVVGMLGAIVEVALYAFVGVIVDMMKAAKTPATFIADNWAHLTFMAFLALILRPLLSTLHDLIKNQIISGPFNTAVRWQNHRYVLRQSLGFYQNDFAGRIANKILQTSFALRESVADVIDALWFAAIHWIGAVILFGQADWRLTLPLLLWMAAYGWTLWYFVPRIRRFSRDASEARSGLTGRIVDAYTNILTVKLFAHAEREDDNARAAMSEHLEKHLISQRNLTTMEFVLFSLNGLLIVVAIGLAIWLWTVQAITIGAVALTTAMVVRIVNMSNWILWTVASIFENIGIVEEGMETISKPHELVDRADASPLKVTAGEIRFDHIRFHYGKETGVIDDLSLTIRPGEKVGLVGRSGAGKSTLVNLLLRFYDLEHGRILIDGTDIAGVTQDSLRSQIGMVTQDTSLLHRSVRDNILYGRPDASEDALVAAAKRAHAHDFIGELADMRGRKGYDAHVGERGVKLSGGQRQRIAIARVLLKDAPILILDEATSALDSEIEATIQEQLYNLMENKTVIAIAHRLSTIAAMDRLIIMDKGCVVEEGTHNDLLNRGGLYAELWSRQSGGFLARDAA